ncbi:family 20 glycosylhydrolase [Gemmatimonadota bacterium]
MSDSSGTISSARLHVLRWALGLLAVTTACSDPEPPLVPWPTFVELRQGELAITPASQIIVQHSELEVLASVLTEEIGLVFGLDLNSGREAQPGDIVLRLDPRLAEEEYTVTTDNMVVVTGGSYAGMALGTTTLLQALEPTTTGAAIPHLEISDSPRSSYRGLLVDLARQWHSIETLKQLVVMCRLYKIRYLHLHLTDNQSFTFPSEAFPELATLGRSYTLNELRSLERFAADRGVIMVPELEIPGHSFSLVSARPDIFGISRRDENPYVINMGKKDAYAALDRIIGEMANVFSSSPFIHIGGDETWLAFLDEDPDAIAFMRDNGISGVDELYRYFIARMNEIVKRHGKQTIVWEGFRKDGEIEIPRDILVMAWETAYQEPQDLLGGGYRIINVSWKPLYVVRNRRWSPQRIYDWNIYRWENWYRPTPSFVPIQLEPDESVIGGQMAAWEQTDVMEVPSLRHRLPVLSERVWNPSLQRGYVDLSRRMSATDKLLQHLIRPVNVKLQGQTFPGYDGSFFNREHWFGDSLEVSVQPLKDSYRVYLSTDTTTTPTQWIRYSEPLQLSETTGLWLRVENGEGEPVGFPWRTDYEFRPLSGTAHGLADLPDPDPASEPSVFHDELTLTLESARADGTIQFTLNGEVPTSTSPVCSEPIVLGETSTIIAQLFDRDGEPRGEPLRREYRRIKFVENITTGKPVTTSQGWPENPSALLAVDGMVEQRDYWGMDAASDSSWIVIDLGELRNLTSTELFTYWDEERYYRYTIELSVDGEVWTQVADASGNLEPATEFGYDNQFPETPARFVRVTMLENSANSWVHIVEVRAY